MIPAFILNFFEVGVIVGPDGSLIRIGDKYATHRYNTVTGELRHAPDRCPNKTSIICGEHKGRQTGDWEPCMCCPNKGAVA